MVSVVELSKIMSGMGKKLRSYYDRQTSYDLEPTQNCSLYDNFTISTRFTNEMTKFYKNPSNAELYESIVSDSVYNLAGQQLTTLAVDSNRDRNILYVGTADGRVVRLPFEFDGSVKPIGEPQTYLIFNGMPVTEIIVFK